MPALIAEVRLPNMTPAHVLDEQKTLHRLIQADARSMPFVPDESVHLVVTSPPYWNLKRYNESQEQLGHINDYETFLVTTQPPLSAI